MKQKVEYQLSYMMEQSLIFICITYNKKPTSKHRPEHTSHDHTLLCPFKSIILAHSIIYNSAALTKALVQHSNTNQRNFE